MTGPRYRLPQRAPSILVGGLLLITGVVIGMALSAELGWLPKGHAVRDVGQPAALAGVSASISPSPIPQSFVPIAKRATPAVVNIFTSRNGRADSVHGSSLDDPFFHRFFGDEFFRRFEAPADRMDRSLGSGVIIEPHGLIITNHHVVNRAEEIKVYLSDKREFKAKLIGADSKTDLALLKIEADGLQTMVWADSDTLDVGEFVLAVGNPFGLNRTVTLGIVSAVGRASMGIAEYEDFIQTDAAINPGNSGGALVNTRGELVGINTAIFSQSGGNMGIGFAVPSNMARGIVEQLVHAGKVVRGWLGVSIQELTPELAAQFGVPGASGVLVSDVLDDSPAKRAGLQGGDIIIEYENHLIGSGIQLRNAVARTPAGAHATLKYIRNTQIQSIELSIAEQPQKLAKVQLDEGGYVTWRP